MEERLLAPVRGNYLFVGHDSGLGLTGGLGSNDRVGVHACGPAQVAECGLTLAQDLNVVVHEKAVANGDGGWVLIGHRNWVVPLATLIRDLAATGIIGAVS